MAAQSADAKRGQARVLLAEACWESGATTVDVLADALAVLRGVGRPGPREESDAEVLAEVVAELGPAPGPVPV